MQRDLIRLATIDPLTGLSNRRGFFERATEACARVAPPDGSLSAIILDIDNFKHINNSYGHETGDEAICCCARAAFLTEAVVGRLGGDEFALLLEDRTLPQAIEIAENLRSRLAAQPFDTGKDRITLTGASASAKGGRATAWIRFSPEPMPRCTTPSSAGEPRGRRACGASDASGNRYQRLRPRFVVLA